MIDKYSTNCFAQWGSLRYFYPFKNPFIRSHWPTTAINQPPISSLQPDNLIQQQDILCRTIFSRPHWPTSYIILYECNFFPPTSKFRCSLECTSSWSFRTRFEFSSFFFHPPPLSPSRFRLSTNPTRPSLHVSSSHWSMYQMNEFLFFFFSKKQDWKGNAFFIKSKIWTESFRKLFVRLLIYDQIIVFYVDQNVANWSRMIIFAHMFV